MKSYGTYRENKRKIVECVLGVALIGLTACNPVLPEEEDTKKEVEVDYEIDGWKQGETGHTSTQPEKNTIQADSVRLGVITPGE